MVALGRLLIATRNEGKLREYQQLLADLPIPLTYLIQEGIAYDVEESGLTFIENAVHKAHEYARLSGLLTLADDSGLEVDALLGEPGIHSARYAGPGATDQDRYRLLLERLEGVPREQRSARFRCAIAVAQPGGETYTSEGVCEGVIAFAPRGEHGFGYDPVFLLPEQGKTMAELPPEVKNVISHRARAAQTIAPILEEMVGRKNV